jgi:hypothetical protein
MPALLDGDGGPVVDELERAGPIGVARDRTRQPLGEHEPVSRVQSGPHPVGVHDEARGDPFERIGRAAGGIRSWRDSLPRHGS